MQDTIDHAIANLNNERLNREIRDVAQVAGLIRLDRTTSFAGMFEGIQLRDQRALIATAVIEGGGPATVTVRVLTPAGEGEPRTLERRDPLVRAIHDLFDRRAISDATMTMTLGIAEVRWEVVIEDRERPQIKVERQESLTTTPEEWDQVIVLRDGAVSHDSAGYLTRTLERALRVIEANARTMPIGYHRHWQMVDAEVLRLEVARRTAEGLV